VKDVTAPDARSIVREVQDTGEPLRGVKPEDLLFAPDTKFFRARGMEDVTFMPYDVHGDRYLHVDGFIVRQNAGKNGRRIRRYPESPFDLAEMLEKAKEKVDGESGGIPVKPNDHEDENEDAKDTAKYVKDAGRKAVLVPGDISEEKQCRQIVERALKEFGQIDIIVNNAATQMPHKSLEEISAEEWDYTFKTNVHAMFYLLKAAEPHLKPGSSVINTTSVNAYTPSPSLIPYTSTKAAIQNFTATLAQLWAEKGIRVNCVAPGPIWTPLIPASFPAERTKEFGGQSPIKRPGQPAELAPAYVLLASPEASYMSGATVPVTGGMPTI